MSGGDNVVRVRSLMRSVSVRLEDDDLKYRIIDKVLLINNFHNLQALQIEHRGGRH